MSHPARPTVAIVLILILAAGLRLYHIGERSLWFDEAATVHIVGQPIGKMLDLIKSDERTPPMHYVILWGWTRVFGNSEVAVRLPSAIAGTAAVGILYLLVRRLFDWKTGAIAALLLAAARYQIDYAQEARAYSLMLLLALWSCYLFVCLMEKPTPRLEAAYVVVTALLLWAHLYGVFAILAQHVAYQLWPGERGEGRKRWHLLNLAALALFSPWLPTAITWARYVTSGFWTPPMTPMQIARTYELYAGSWIALGLLLLLATVGVARRWDRRAMPLLLGLMFLPVLVPSILGALSRPTFTDRYAIFAPAGLYALAAAGIAALRWTWLRIAYIAAVCVVGFFGRLHVFEKPDWRSAGAYLTASMRPIDAAVINRKNHRYLYEYYVRRPDVRLTGFDGPALPLTLPLPAGKHIWLIASDSGFPSSQMLARAPWNVLSRRAFGAIEIFELTDEPTPTEASPPPTSATLPTSRSP